MNPFTLQETEHKEKYGLLPSIYFAMVVVEPENSLETVKLTVDDVLHFDERFSLIKDGFLPIIAKK